MSVNIEKILSDARHLVNRLRDHDTSADTLIEQTHAIHQKVNGMKQYQDDINQLNEIARHRPRSALIIGLAQENKLIRELQQENRDLKLSLEEHQTALELIMSKYREHVLKLMMTKKVDHSVSSSLSATQNCEKIDKIWEMVSIMQQAIVMDDECVAKEQETLKRLEIENEGLREMLHIKLLHNKDTDDKAVQVNAAEIEVDGSSHVTLSEVDGSSLVTLSEVDGSSHVTLSEVDGSSHVILSEVNDSTVSSEADSINSSMDSAEITAIHIKM